MDLSVLSLSDDDLRIALEALFHDTSCPVSVIDANGVVIATNGAFAAARGQEPQSVLNQKLADSLGHEVAQATIALVRNALERGGPVVAEGIWQGDRYRTTFRPISPAPDGTGRVLVVAPSVFTVSGVMDTPSDYPIVEVDIAKTEPLASLTERELEVLKLIGEGLSTSEIAETLHRSIKTVEGHRASIGKKLNVTNRVELARLAIRAGVTRLAEGGGGPVADE